MKIVYIRTDANRFIATGHMMRCMTIANEIIKMGAMVKFIVSNEESLSLLKSTPFKYSVLNTSWDDLNNTTEIEKIKELMDETDASDCVLLVDSYFVDNRYFDMLKGLCKTTIIDDLNKCIYDVDLLINYSIYCSEYDYLEKYHNKKIKLLLGTRYVPLREEFSISPQRTKDERTKLLFVSGGGDPENVMNSILDYGIKNDMFCLNCEYEFVLGAYNPFAEEFEKKIEGYENVHAIRNTKDMATLMRSADVLVSAASTVLYEACAVGIPTIFFCMADNQENDGKYFCKMAKMIYAGDIRYQREKCVENIFSEIEYLTNNQMAQKEMSLSMKRIVDGHGASRIAEEIVAL